VEKFNNKVAFHYLSELSINIPGFIQLSNSLVPRLLHQWRSLGTRLLANGRVRACWFSWIQLLVFCWNIGHLAWG